MTGSRASAAPKGAGVPTRFPSEVTKPNGRVRLSRPITALTVLPETSSASSPPGPLPRVIGVCAFAGAAVSASAANATASSLIRAT